MPAESATGLNPEVLEGYKIGSALQAPPDTFLEASRGRNALRYNRITPPVTSGTPWGSMPSLRINPRTLNPQLQMPAWQAQANKAIPPA